MILQPWFECCVTFW